MCAAELTYTKNANAADTQKVIHINVLAIMRLVSTLLAEQLCRGSTVLPNRYSLLSVRLNFLIVQQDTKQIYKACI